MSNAARKMKRSKMPKVPRCCGQKMMWKASMNCYVCMMCGKVKRVQE